MEKEILTITDVSALLALPEAEVGRLFSRGELPGKRVGAHWYISRARLLQFIADVERPHPAPELSSMDAPKSLPEKALAPRWRCHKCEEIHPPDVVECSHCGAPRKSPLLGYRIDRSRWGF